MLRIMLERVAFLKILKVRICRCDIRRFKYTFSLTDRDTEHTRTHARTHIYRYMHVSNIHLSYTSRYKGTRTSAFYVSHFTSHIFLALLFCYFPVLDTKTLDFAKALSHVVGLKLISIYASFQEYAHIFRLSR